MPLAFSNFPLLAASRMALLTFAPLSDLGVGQAWAKEPIHSRFIDNSRGSIKEIDRGIIYIYIPV